ncbi:BnaC04g06190D [Brassica napus]|uniref:BnaC04g06190D protein n=1 Tax=Brassica napus TaxID=3708 RepID=A0A078I6A5_BRANA|nr:BnaC04g06190D [Brassica napus]
MARIVAADDDDGTQQFYSMELNSISSVSDSTLGQLLKNVSDTTTMTSCALSPSYSPSTTSLTTSLSVRNSPSATSSHVVKQRTPR